MITKNGIQLCDRCFKPMTPNGCTSCGDGSEIRSPVSGVLGVGSILKGRYILGKKLGSGGFGVTYLAYRYDTDYVVAIKEYFPESIAHRGEDGQTVFPNEDCEALYMHGKEKFYSEASLLCNFSSIPGIVRVEDYFDENNTSYMVMEYLEGMDLRSYMRLQGDTTHLTADQMIRIMIEVCASLSVLHNAGYGNSVILHRDIAPDNIFLCRDGRIKLIDFGSARQVVENGLPKSTSVSMFVKGGFSAPEQYVKGGDLGPWTDIYSLGATAYYAISGKLLDIPVGKGSNDHLLEYIALSKLYGIIKKCTEFYPNDRYHDVESLKRELEKLLPAPIPDASPVNDQMVPNEPFIYKKPILVLLIILMTVISLAMTILVATILLNGI